MEILGIDIGGSGMKGAIVNITNGEFTSERYREATPLPSTPKAVAKTVAKMAEHFQWKGLIGCGFPSVIQKGKVLTAANIDKKWIDTRVESLFEEATGCIVKVVNDADAAGLAEATFGAGKGIEGLAILLTVGTGIGSAFIQDGLLVPNSELGHLRFKGSIAEHYASDAVRKKEELSWHIWGKRFNEYLNYVYSLFYPDVIILGGGASKKYDKFEDVIDVPTTVITAKLLNQAGIIGAALSAKALVKTHPNL
ncbi:MAG: ROK family protein [Bacteroidia bacterium]|nr:ROK family protein [Bacteroidia bacterium]